MNKKFIFLITLTLIITIMSTVSVLKLDPRTKKGQLQKHVLIHQGNFFFTEIFIAFYLYFNRTHIKMKTWLSFLLFLLIIQELMYVKHITKLFNIPKEQIQETFLVKAFIGFLFWVIFAQQVLFTIFLVLYLAKHCTNSSDDDYLGLHEFHNQAILDQLKPVKYKNIKTNISECSICMDHFENCDIEKGKLLPVVQLTCHPDHVMHHNCLK